MAALEPRTRESLPAPQKRLRAVGFWLSAAF